MNIEVDKVENYRPKAASAMEAEAVDVEGLSSLHVIFLSFVEYVYMYLYIYMLVHISVH